MYVKVLWLVTGYSCAIILNLTICHKQTEKHQFHIFFSPVFFPSTKSLISVLPSTILHPHCRNNWIIFCLFYDNPMFFTIKYFVGCQGIKGYWLQNLQLFWKDRSSCLDWQLSFLCCQQCGRGPQSTYFWPTR